MSNSSCSRNNKVVLILFALRLLTSLVHGTPHYSIIKSSCQTTLYPEICYSTFPNSIAKNLVTKKDVIEHAINKTKDTIQANIHAINNLTAATNLTKRSKTAFHDCLELGTGTLEQLDKVIQDLRAYPNKKTLRKHADDLKTLMSTTITNTVTCLDGFSHDAACKRLRKSIKKGQDHGGKMCSNALAMIKNLTDTDIAKEAKYNKQLKEEKAIMWPEWLSKKERKLLQSGGVTPNVTVAVDGSGMYTTVSAAVTAAPSKSQSRYVIKIKAGVYRENVQIPSSKTNLMFVGDGRSNTIITASNSVASGSTTFNSATVAAVGDGFLARDITFQNAAGPSGNQAVALRVGSDLSAFYQCGMIAYQDTLYVHSNRQFYVNCYVAGTVDFTFGNAAVVFQDCQFQARCENRCTFLNPHLISSSECLKNDKQVMKHILDTKRRNPGKEIYLAPYLKGERHWLLFVVCPNLRTGYIVDSAKEDSEKNYYFPEIVERAFEIKFDWTMTKCFQQKGGWECGYYLMKFMHELVIKKQADFPKSLWKDTRRLQPREIDEVATLVLNEFYRDVVLAPLDTMAPQ